MRAWLPNHLSIGSERIEDRTQTELVKGILLKKINDETNLLNFFFLLFRTSLNIIWARVLFQASSTLCEHSLGLLSVYVCMVQEADKE